MNRKRGPKPPRGKFSILTLILTSLALLLSVSVKAHTVEQFYADYRQGSGTVEINFDVAYAVPEIRDIPEAPQPKRSWLVQQTDQQHHKLQQEAELYLLNYIHFELNGKLIDHKISFPEFDQKPYPFIKLLNEGAYYRIKLTPNIPPHSTGQLSLRIKDGAFPNLIVARHNDQATSFETIEPKMALKLDHFDNSSSTLELIILGFRHVIPEGLDHVLFIIGICLMASSVRLLLYQSLIFTAAHALSMALVISQIFPIYSYGISTYIEAIIALSIAFIAIENLFFRSALKWSFTIIAIFGFIHGLGFAGSLGSTLQFLNADNWITPLIWANVGIEIAQAILVITTFIILLYIRNNHSPKIEKNLRITTSLVIATFSLVWFLQRLP